jgi:hypothetical protein
LFGFCSGRPHRWSSGWCPRSKAGIWTKGCNTAPLWERRYKKWWELHPVHSLWGKKGGGKELKENPKRGSERIVVFIYGRLVPSASSVPGPVPFPPALGPAARPFFPRHLPLPKKNPRESREFHPLIFTSSLLLFFSFFSFFSFSSSPSSLLLFFFSSPPLHLLGLSEPFQKRINRLIKYKQSNNSSIKHKQTNKRTQT